MTLTLLATTLAFFTPAFAEENEPPPWWTEEAREVRQQSKKAVVEDGSWQHQYEKGIRLSKRGVQLTWAGPVVFVGGAYMWAVSILDEHGPLSNAMWAGVWMSGIGMGVSGPIMLTVGNHRTNQALVDGFGEHRDPLGKLSTALYVTSVVAVPISAATAELVPATILSPFACLLLGSTLGTIEYWTNKHTYPTLSATETVSLSIAPSRLSRETNGLVVTGRF